MRSFKYKCPGRQEFNKSELCLLEDSITIRTVASPSTEGLHDEILDGFAITALVSDGITGMLPKQSRLQLDQSLTRHRDRLTSLDEWRMMAKLNLYLASPLIETL